MNRRFFLRGAGAGLAVTIAEPTAAIEAAVAVAAKVTTSAAAITTPQCSALVYVRIIIYSVSIPEIGFDELEQLAFAKNLGFSSLPTGIREGIGNTADDMLAAANSWASAKGRSRISPEIELEFRTRWIRCRELMELTKQELDELENRICEAKKRSKTLSAPVNTDYELSGDRIDRFGQNDPKRWAEMTAAANEFSGFYR